MTASQVIEAPQRVLVVSPHPDDAEYDAGGTIASWAAAGAHITLALCADGGKGSRSKRMPPERVASVREREQRAAAKVLGIREVACLGYPDAELENTTDLRHALVCEIRRRRPDIVLSPDPWRRTWYLHRDHRVAGEAALDAAGLARWPLYCPEHLAAGLRPHLVHEVWLWDSEEPNKYVDVTYALERKARALCQHRQQARSLGGLAGAEVYVRETAHAAGAHARLRYAEAFRAIPLPAWTCDI